MSRKLVVISAFVFLAAFLAGCGGSDDGGLFKNAGPQQQQGQTNPTNAAPDVPKQQQSQPAQPGQPNQPFAVPSIVIPQVVQGSTTGACALLSKQDAAAALGAPVNDARSLDIPKQNMGAFTVDISSCEYERTSGSAASVQLQTWKAGDANTVKTMAGFVCQTKEKIAGLGDVACWYAPDHKELQAFKGGSFVSLTVRGAPGNADDTIKALAKRIVDRVQ